MESDENEHTHDSNPSGWLPARSLQRRAKPDDTAGWESRRYKRNHAMKKKSDRSADTAELRCRAEERLQAREQTPQSAIRNPQSDADTARLVHELQVHQIELEMQNEELRQAHAQVEMLLAQYTNLYDFAPAGYMTLDREGAIRQVNLTAAQMLGVERSQLVNRRFGLFVAEGDRHIFGDFLGKVFASQDKESCELTLQHESSRPVVVQIEGTRSADGQECRAVMLEITERKRQERGLIEKSTELERFTYTVSHDLKGPLVTMKTFLGYLDLDMAGSDQERIKQDVGYMCMAADKMGHLLDELLNLARVGRQCNPSVRVTFKELAREAVGLVAGRISISHAEVQVADAAVVLDGDRPRLVEIWQNLVENACKFMGDQPKPRVEIGVEQRGGETVFFVRDNGAGIDPRFREKVFGLFEKLDPKGEGTGMGLALVKRVVELYQGRIWVESGGLGQGASFLFTLPAAVVAGIQPAVSGGILPPGAPPNGEATCM
jgi:PAS domain S-box-containing protein